MSVKMLWSHDKIWPVHNYVNYWAASDTFAAFATVAAGSCGQIIINQVPGLVSHSHWLVPV